MRRPQRANELRSNQKWQWIEYYSYILTPFMNGQISKRDTRCREWKSFHKKKVLRKKATIRWELRSAIFFCFRKTLGARKRIGFPLNEYFTRKKIANHVVFSEIRRFIWLFLRHSFAQLKIVPFNHLRIYSAGSENIPPQRFAPREKTFKYDNVFHLADINGRKYRIIQFRNFVPFCVLHILFISFLYNGYGAGTQHRNW